MPAATSSERPPRHDDLDNYNVDDLSDDPFASPPSSPKKRKQGDAGLGIDEEVSVSKRQRAPAVKLDEERLLSDRGIPELRRRARKLKIKGKGHEFSDATRLLSFYQLWLDDLFPKAKFLDALAMVEKLGHKKQLTVARSAWIEEGRPKPQQAEDDDAEQNAHASEAAPAQEKQTEQQRPHTPPAGDVPDDDDDLYDATPRPASRPPAAGLGDDIPDDDELDALMAEYGGPGDEPPAPAPQPPRNVPVVEDDDDDLEFLMAESEQRDKPASRPEQTGQKGGDGANPVDKSGERDVPDEEEMEGLWD